MSDASPVLGVLACLMAAALAVPVLVLAAEILGSVFHEATPPFSISSERHGAGPVAVLMPAHDEATGIQAAIAPLLGQLRLGDRLLVVADNCTDATAEVARAAGADVIERVDQGRRGKGYALDFGVRHLAERPPETVVIVDADCVVASGGIDALVASARASGRPSQARYLMHAPPAAPLRTRIAEFAWVLKNEVRPSGAHRLGWPCQLMGSGMAFPWPLIRAAPLASGHIVEDLQLGLDLARSGHAPVYCAAATVTSAFPTQDSALASQRTRWEHGHLAVIAANAPGMLWTSLRRGDRRIAMLALDLCVPPLSSLVLLQGASLILALIAAAVGAGSSALAVSLVSCVILAASLGTAWFRSGRHILTARDWLSVPGYVFAKVPLYARMLRRRQAEWVRTKRDDGSH